MNAFRSRDKRVLPHNLDAEASVLGGVLLRNEVLARIPDVGVDDFYDHRHKVVFAAMRNLQAAGEPLDVVTIENEIEKRGKLDSLGGVAFLGELALRVPTADNVVAYAAIVRQKAAVRSIMLAAGDIMESGYEDGLELDEYIGTATRKLGDLIAPHAHLARGESEAATRWTPPLSIFMGDDEPDDDDSVDWIVRDLIPRGEAVLWGGPMKGGKTWSALDLCIAIALGEDWLGGAFRNELGTPAKVAGIFLEDNERRLRKRLWELCRGRGITPNDPRLRANLTLSRTPLRLPDAKDQRALIAEIKRTGAVVMFIDNLTRVMIGDPNSTKDAAAFTRAWTEIGEATGASLAFLHHTKKPSGDAREQDPFDALRGSGDFGATARNIVVTKPIKLATDEKASELRVRGNLDLRRESAVVGFSRVHLLDRWQARLTDRGNVKEVFAEVREKEKDEKESKKKSEFAAETAKRRSIALMIVTKERFITQGRMAQEMGMQSARTFAPLIAAMVADGTLESAGKHGYQLAGTSRQEGLRV